MKNTIKGISLILVLSGAIFAQVDSKTTSSVENTTSVNKNSGTMLQSGTRIAAQLQNSLDVKKAKVGDEVVLKTTSAIKQNGQTVVKKGSSLIGHVTEVQQKMKGQSMSKIGVVFDSMQNGKMIMPISTTIVSLTQAQSNTNINDDSLGLGSSSSASSSTKSSGDGGLLGTVGGVVKTTTNTVGSTVNNTTGNLGETLKGIQITQSLDVSANGSSTLSTQSGNLKLEKGTTFNLRVTESSTIQNRK